MAGGVEAPQPKQPRRSIHRSPHGSHSQGSPPKESPDAPRKGAAGTPAHSGRRRIRPADGGGDPPPAGARGHARRRRGGPANLEGGRCRRPAGAGNDRTAAIGTAPAGAPRAGPRRERRPASRRSRVARRARAAAAARSRPRTATPSESCRNACTYLPTAPSAPKPRRPYATCRPATGWKSMAWWARPPGAHWE